MALSWPAKDPDEVLDYSWTPAIDTGDTLDTATLSVISGTAVIDSQSVASGVLTAFISGGAADEVTAFLARATTAAGRTFEETIYLPIRASTGSSLAGELIATFPDFADVPTATIDIWLARAARSITSVFGDDQDFAQMLLAAHLMTLRGLGAGTEAQMAAQGAAGVTEMASGTLRLKFEKSASMGTYGATAYGRQLYPLLKAYLGGPRVTGTGTFPFYPNFGA